MARKPKADKNPPLEDLHHVPKGEEDPTQRLAEEQAAARAPQGDPHQPFLAAKPGAQKSAQQNGEAKPKSKIETGPEVIARILKTLPGSPGVYRMIDPHGTVLYVGKARNLTNRVQSYTRLSGHTNRIARMILSTAAMEFITTTTEAEALLLEANLIKRFKPHFNVLLRDDKSFPYILIARDHDAPQILKHRGARKRKGDYFGPFAAVNAVNKTLNTMQRAFLLRSCSDSVYESRTRPCLLYQIKRCSAPCTGEISLEDYSRLVDQACNFLRGESKDVRARLEKNMQAASDNLEFERAASFRDRLQAISQVQSHQGISAVHVDEADIFAAHSDAGQVCIQVFFFRMGQNWGNRAYFPKADKSLNVEDVLDSFIAQFYDNKPCPKLILLSHTLPGQDLLAEALSTRLGRKVTLSMPQRGEKSALVAHALTNAREALGRRLAENASQRRLLEGVASSFQLPSMPRRIEVYDNSHISGTNAVGAMIVAGLEGFAKKQYRKFNIKSESLTPGDDMGMMREVLTRRFARLQKEHGAERANEKHRESSERYEEIDDKSPDDKNLDDKTQDDKSPDADTAIPAWPDLLLIDGGLGQLNAVHEVLDELNVSDVAVIGIAKGPERNAGRERFFIKGQKPFSLEPRDPVLYFVQRLRDEAHRFAIGAHRARRKKAIGANPLDEIAGIGPTRKKALLTHFGSAKAVSRAGMADLQAVEGISAQMAQSIYDFFHDSEG